MFKKNNDGLAAQVSIRMNDGALLIGSVSCGMTGKLEGLLASDIKFVEFMSRDGQQRFIAHHQIASIEPLASLDEPTLADVVDEAEPFGVLGLQKTATLDEAMTSFQSKLAVYSAERWTGADIPFEFSRYASQKTKQLNAAFTAVKNILQMKADQLRAEQGKPLPVPGGPMFGAARTAA